MQNIAFDDQGINQREFSYYIFFSTAVLFLLFMIGLSAWFLSSAMTPSSWIAVGQLSEFPPMDKQGEVRPYKIEIAESTYIWLVNLDGEVSLFSPYTTIRWLPVHAELGCRFAWNRASGRFEDPCSGSKYRLDGTIIGGPATRDLDYYTVKIEGDGDILINVNELTAGQCRDLYTGSSRAISYAVWDEVPPVCDE